MINHEDMLSDTNCHSTDIAPDAGPTIQLDGKANSETTAAKTEHIEGKGCVKPGRQKGCFVVNDIKAHRKYNVFFDGKSQPDMYTAISFEGIGYQHVSHCSQGQKVQVTEWKPLPGECSKPNVTQGKPQ